MEFAAPDLDLIKQEEQGRAIGTGGLPKAAASLNPPRMGTGFVGVTRRGTAVPDK
jgi:hypothetical protein